MKSYLTTIILLTGYASFAQVTGDFYGSTDGTKSIDLKLGKNGSGSSFKIFSEDPGGSTYWQIHGRRWGAGYTWSRESNGGTDKKIAYLYGGSSGQYYQLFHDDQSVKVQFHSNGNSYINGGNFGIGTASPSEQLNVVSSTSGVLTRFASSANGGLSGLRVQGKTNDGTDTRFVDLFFDPETYTYGFGAGTNSGQLPINSGASQGDLVIDVNGNIELKGTTTIKGDKIRFSESRGLDYEPTSDAIFYNGYNNGQVAMLSDRDGNSWFNGNMGIGTSNTFGYKLAVNGTIGSTEVKVENTSAWPDFVFESDYELLSLQEVEEHITKKGHLPEIPSEAEVTKNGINLGKMDAKLLQKIEELTLYLIEQNKQNQAQQARIEQLEKELKALKN